MALLSRPLTEDEVHQMVDDWRKGWPAIPSFYDYVVAAMAEPRVHVVHYFRDGRVKYVAPDTFWLGPSGDTVMHVRELK